MDIAYFEFLTILSVGSWEADASELSGSNTATRVHLLGSADFSHWPLDAEISGIHRPIPVGRWIASVRC
jgi:hypothetical protein